MMPTLQTTITSWQWPLDVVEFAMRHQVDAFLTPLLEATQRVYPTARHLRVSLELDPELRDDWHIVFEVEVPQADVPNYVLAQHAWGEELFRICPAPLVCVFRLALIRVAP
jgi:hypothetical protein